MDQKTDRWTFLICLLLGLIIFIVFYQVHNFKFITYDDPYYIYNNPEIQSGFNLKSIKWAFTTGWTANWIPLTWLSYILDWKIFGSNPAGFHVVNLIFHIANTLLLFIVLKLMTRSTWPSAFVAALFALHPLHIQSVAWVSERKDVLSTFFWMLAMLAYFRYVNRPSLIRYLFTILFFIFGLLSKPMLVTLPFIFLLLDYWPLERFQQKSFLFLIKEKIPLFILSIASSVITFIVQRNNTAAVSFDLLPLKFRILNAFVSYAEYMKKMFWPVNLSVFYPHPGRNISLIYAITAACILLMMTILVIRLSKNHRYLFTGWFWFLGTLVPVIGIIQVGIQGMADRYTYIPLTGLFIIIAFGLPEILSKLRYKKIVLASSAIISILILSICTYIQLGHWRNTQTLFQHAIDVTKDNYMAMNELAWYISVDPKIESYNPSKAIEHAGKACEITHYNSPEYIDTLAIAYAAAGDFNEAIKVTQKSLQLCKSYGNTALREELMNRLILYQQGKPYIENEQ